MLRELTIKNYALIEDLSISFFEGLNVITGETGAGKSIIIGALGLLLGERAQAEVIRKGEDSCEVTGLFSVENPATDLEKKPAGEFVLKRVIAEGGKSKCYINGNAVTLAMLADSGNHLVDVHGQGTHQLILNTAEQLNIVDRYGGLYGKRDAITAAYESYRKKKEELEELKSLENEKQGRQDLYKFQYDEIRNAGLKNGEDEELERELGILNNSEKLAALINDIYEKIYEADGSIKKNMDDVKKQLDKLAGIDPGMQKYAGKIAEMGYELEEIIAVFEKYAQKLQFNPGRLEEVVERLETIKRLKKKYGGTIGETIKSGEDFKKKLDEIENSAETLEKTEKRVSELEAGLMKTARDLSEKRKKVSADLSRKVELELKDLAMNKTRFSIDIREKEISSTGVDELEFLIAPNVGEDLKPLSKIASGGESSRTMLAIKTVLARADSVPLLIFDEIDSGVGGSAAGVIGKKLKALNKRHQVICITHLPQLAGYADAHFYVGKVVEKGRTKTFAKKLGTQERISEIARMLGGETATETVNKHAREILEQSIV